MFEVGGFGAGGAGAVARLDSPAPAAPAAAMAPGATMAGSSSGNPLAPTHPAGVAFWVGVTSVVLLCVLYYSLPE